jgi:CheY-like chemotaxis protein
MIRMTLEACGYTVLDTGPGADAIALAQPAAPPVHLLVTEVDVPGMRDHELTAPAMARYAESPCLYIVDAVAEMDLRQRLANGGLAVLHKPFTPAALAQKVREVLDQQDNAPKQGE